MISIIAAIGKNNVIGISNKLPWDLPADLAYFSRVTTGQSVLMGKNTFLSIIDKIGHPLQNRKNYVVSQTLKEYAGIEIVDNLEKFIENKKDDDIFIIGGDSIFRQTIDLANRLYITEVACEVKGDTFFPEINLLEWKLISEEKHLADKKNIYNYNFKIYDRK